MKYTGIWPSGVQIFSVVRLVLTRLTEEEEEEEEKKEERGWEEGTSERRTGSKKQMKNT